MDSNILKRIIQTRKLTAKQMSSLAKGEFFGLDIWVDIIKTRNLSRAQMLEVGFKQKSEVVWDAIAFELDWTAFTPKRMLALGEKASSEALWIGIVRSRRLPKDDMVAIGREVNSRALRLVIFENTELDSEDALQLARAGTYDDVWRRAIPEITWADLPYSDLIQIGCQTKRPDVWIAIIGTGKISAKDMLEIQREFEGAKTEEILLAVIKTNKLSIDELLAAGKKRSDQVWAAIADAIELKG